MFEKGSFRRLAKKLNVKRWLWLSLTCFLVGLFFILTSEMREFLSGQKELIGQIDESLLRFVVSFRNSQLNGIATDLTALGSASVLSILITGACLLFYFSGKRILSAQILLSAAGAAVLTSVLKSYFERSRPDALLRVVEVQGFSYPSGHSLSSAALYFSLALALTDLFQRPLQKFLIFFFMITVVFLVGGTRIYLGVHFFSDVSAGILLGIAWASLLEFLKGSLHEKN